MNNTIKSLFSSNGKMYFIDNKILEFGKNIIQYSVKDNQLFIDLNSPYKTF